MSHGSIACVIARVIFNCVCELIYYYTRIKINAILNTLIFLSTHRDLSQLLKCRRSICMNILLLISSWLLSSHSTTRAACYYSATLPKLPHVEARASRFSSNDREMFGESRNIIHNTIRGRRPIVQIWYLKWGVPESMQCTQLRLRCSSRKFTPILIIKIVSQRNMQIERGFVLLLLCPAWEGEGVLRNWSFRRFFERRPIPFPMKL